MCFYNVFTHTSFGIELELCIKILNEEFLKQVSSDEEDKINTDIRSNLELLLNHKLKGLMVPGSKGIIFYLIEIKNPSVIVLPNLQENTQW